jgi:hypothetical protein
VREREDALGAKNLRVTVIQAGVKVLISHDGHAAIRYAGGCSAKLATYAKENFDSRLGGFHTNTNPDAI